MVGLQNSDGDPIKVIRVGTTCYVTPETLETLEALKTEIQMETT